MSKAREVAREIAASARIIAGNDLTAWFNIHHLRGAIFRVDGQRSRVEPSAVMKEFEIAGVIEAMSGGYSPLQVGLRQNPAGDRQGPQSGACFRNIQLDLGISMRTLSCQPPTRRRGAATRSRTVTIAVVLSILAMTLSTARSEAHCFSRWHYPWKQRCSGALPKPPKPIFQAKREEQTGTPREQITFPLPSLGFEICPDGDERLHGDCEIAGFGGCSARRLAIASSRRVQQSEGGSLHSRSGSLSLGGHNGSRSRQTRPRPP